MISNYTPAKQVYDILKVTYEGTENVKISILQLIQKASLRHVHIFGSKCFILNDWEQLGKFEFKSDEAIFLGYSPNSSAYKVFNKKDGIGNGEN